MNKPDINSLWPVSILTNKLSDHKNLNPQLISLFNDYRQQHPQKSNYGYVSPDNFSRDITNPALDTLKKFILDNVFHIAAKINTPYWQEGESIDINVTGLWFQISNGYSFHETHIHGNCSWSGVYYVQSGQSSKGPNDRMENGMLNGITRFYGPHMEYGAAGHGDKGNYYLQDSAYDSYPEDGKLIIFPSHIKHMVFPYQGEDDRIIVSFHAQVNGAQSYNYGFN